MLIALFILLCNIIIAVLKACIRFIIRPSEKSVVGETVLVTGAGHGMGRLYALKFATLGARVIVVDVNETGNCETARLVKKCGASAYSYTCDLRSKDNIKSLAKKVKQEVGNVTILVNNAGVLFSSDILSLSDEMIAATFDVNILSHFWLIREFLPDMKKNNHGHIVAMGSYGSKYTSPFLIDYCSSKHAVLGLMDGLERELRWQGKTGVKTTCAFPSFVSTGFVKNPTTQARLLMPVLEPAHVVDVVMHGMLTDQRHVEVPSMASMHRIAAFFPREVAELIFDFIHPQVDKVKSEKDA